MSQRGKRGSTGSETVREGTEETGPQARGALRGVVLVTGGGAVGRVIPVPPGVPITFGRTSSATVELPDTGISRTHAEILARDGEHVIRDLGSLNGTFVNEVKVDFATPLAHGDLVRLGSVTRMRFTLVDEAEERDLVQMQDALAHEASRLAKGPAPRLVGTAPGEVVRDPAMQALYEQARLAAQSTLSVLVLGETGCGKEVLARAIHRASPRAEGPFLALHCASLPDSLLEAELFGHEQGAFTGAAKARSGLFEAADGGTVLLDEVGELPLSVQVKLLRVLEERAVMRVGARAPRAIDVRFVAATNRDLAAAVARGSFREDLFFRLNGMTLTIPPLRERRTEIPELVALFVTKACADLGRRPEPTVADETRALLTRYAWPGNVRELRNVIHRAVVLCTGPSLLPAHLPPELLRAPEAQAPAASQLAPVAGESLRDRLAEIEKERILSALERFGGNQTRVAAELGMSRRTLVTRLQEWGLTRPRQKPGG